jgi:nucleotide-binding universal stress UspA family protein
MLETILCGVDESDAAGGVVRTAHWLADQLESRLVLIHVSDEPIRDADGVLASIRDRLGLGSGDDLRSTEGTPAQSLIDEVKHVGADLLVVGSRGRGPISSAVFGSVSRTLVTGASCPVVVVPPDVKPTEELSPSDPSIICGVDGSGHAIAAAR